MFDWRIENKKDFYGTIVEWWKKHKAFNEKVIEYKALPNRIFIVSSDGIDLFAVPVYITDSDFCHIGWITSNPDAPLKSKGGALEYLYGIISIVMKSQGFDRILSKTNDRSLMRVLENSEYKFIEKANWFYKDF